MNATKRLNRIVERVNALSLRERGLLALAVLAVVLLAWDLAWMQPVSQRESNVRSELSSVRERVDDLTRTLQSMAGASNRDPNAELAQRRDALEEEIDVLETRLAERHGTIATSQESISILTGLLARRAGVDIVALENLPPDRMSSQSGDVIPGLFVHRVRVVVESDFAGVRDYLAATADLPEGIFWQSFELSVDEWPTSRVELILYTITLDDRWLGV